MIIHCVFIENHSLWERFKEEVRDWWNQKETSPLCWHAEQSHKVEKFEVGVEVLSKSFGKPSSMIRLFMFCHPCMGDALGEESVINPS